MSVADDCGIISNINKNLSKGLIDTTESVGKRYLTERMNKNMNIKKAILFMILAFSVCACGKSVDQTEKSEVEYMEGMEHLLEGNSMGYYFSVYPEETQGELRLNSWDEQLKFMVESAGDERQFAVYFLCDYQQIPIIIDGVSYEQFYIGVHGNYSGEYSFSLAEEPEPGKVHKLTAIMTAYSDVLMAEQEDIPVSSKDSLILNFNLYIGDAEETASFEMEPAKADLLYDSEGSGIILNTYTDELVSKIPAKEVHVQRGESLTIQYHAGAFENNDFLMFVTAGYEQMKLDGQEYLYFTDLPSRQLAAGYCQMETPKEPGRYEVIGYVIPEPFLEKGISAQHPDESYRFTLVVE